jgi:hypothetical protein
MAIGSSRQELKVLAQLKFDDATLLFANERYSNAYYLAGYVIEFGLKACIARQIMPETIPPKRFVNDIHTHDFEKLVAAAGLKAELRVQQDVNHNFQAYWGLAGDWSPDVRYQTADPIMAQLLLQAVGDPNDGILPWIKTVW